MRSPSRAAVPFARQRGIALITAVLVVALATILAINVAFRGFVDQRRSGNLFAIDQAFQIALGAEALAADVLRNDLKDSKTDYVGEAWSQPVKFPLDDGIGTVEGQIEDQQGRFNLNSLVTNEGKTNPAAVQQLERILGLLKLDTQWASAIADWIDSDTQPGFPSGAEDSIYTSETPPHLAANMPITRISELLQLQGFGAERYAKLKPFVSALPVGTKLNVCTASGIVLDSLFEGTQQFSMNPDALKEQRQHGNCFPSMRDLEGTLGTVRFNKVRNSLSESSSYFQALVWVTIGTTEFTLYSLLARGSGGIVRPVSHSFGTD